MGRREVEVEVEEKLSDTAQDRCSGGPRVAGDITFFFFFLKSSCFKLSNLWALERPCGAGEILKVRAKLLRKTKF